LENNQLDTAIEMYQNLFRWDEAIELAEKKNHRNLDDLKRIYYQYLVETDQLEKAGAVKEKEGDLNGAVSLYLKANLPVRAARVVSSNQELMHNQDLINRIAATLIKLDFYESVSISTFKNFNNIICFYYLGWRLV
jgi:intraflagellar transport protein 172